MFLYNNLIIISQYNKCVKFFKNIIIIYLPTSWDQVPKNNKIQLIRLLINYYVHEGYILWPIEHIPTINTSYELTLQ